MVERLTPDICVIGAGSGGLSVAAAAARFGVPVVLIERGRMGGDCLNYGCVPSKALLAAAKRAHALTQIERFGVKVQRAKIEFLDVHAHVMDVIRAIAPNDSKERLTGLGVHVLAGVATFRDRRTVTVGKEVEIRARRFVLAAGSMPAIPPIPGLRETPHLTNETIFDLTHCPRHLIVIGAGPIGLELAQAHRRLGAEVTVLEAAAPLTKDDPECAAVVLDQLARDGVVLRANTNILRAERGRGKVRVIVDAAGNEEVIEGSHLLVAAGRRANVEGLNLEAAGIAYDQTGIAVNKRLRTTNRRVYAIGDAAKGAPQFTHVAGHHAGLVIRNALFRLPVNATKALVPWVTYTDPELAHVGLREEEARARYGTIRVLRWPYHENDRAQAEREIEGHIKVVTTKRGRIVGVTIVGAQAGELITTWTLAINQRLKVSAWLSLVVPYPTLAEIGKRSAISYYAPGLTSPLIRRIIRFLRRFG
ncbi:MAG TPA: FAD-dependent oxidoreductase [Xanthobacteraceae bacterium]|nr:FAD-dependent oxidoreductase [Xanthobacteraceae bacterium]